MSDVIICHEDFDVGLEYASLCAASAHSGAVVFFVGLVRDLYDLNESNTPDNAIEYLELEHYPGMTESLCQEIINEAASRYSFDQARVIHRVGKLYAKQQIVMVAVASCNRDNAFQAAQFIMDFLKTRATFWKKEVGAKGENWLGLKDRDIDATERWSKK